MNQPAAPSPSSQAAPASSEAQQPSPAPAPAPGGENAPPISQSFVVTVIPATPAPETTVGGVILGSLGIAGTLLLLALVLGVAMAAVRVGFNRRYHPEDDHLPPVVPGPET